MLGGQNINKPVSMNERPFVSTFHSLGVHIIKEQSAKLDLDDISLLHDRDDSKGGKEARKVQFDVKTHDPARYSIISKRKAGLNETDYENRSEEDTSDVVEMVWEYEKILKTGLDFDDLL